MKKIIVLFVLPVFASIAGQAQTPDNLVAEGIPAIPTELKKDMTPYLEFRSATFNGWHPLKREMLITTRFADVTQLHLVRMPGGARKQLTFSAEPVSGGSFQPRSGEYLIFSQDTGGGEFYQIYRYDLANGKSTLLTDGKSRNTSARWSNNGESLAYCSTRRNGKDNDIYVINPADPKSDRLLLQVSGGGWGVEDWSPGDSRLIVSEYISINESYLHLANAKTGAKEQLTAKGADKVAYAHARFARDGKSVFAITDKESEYRRLVRIDPVTKRETVLTDHIRWDIDGFALSHDGKTIAFTANEDGVGVLHLLNVKAGKEMSAPKLPLGAVSNLDWHKNNRDLAFNLNSARSPVDVYSLDSKTGNVERWTESETGGLDPAKFVEPKLVKLRSFDEVPISAFVYRPERATFPDKHPVLISIHGGPEAQFRPGFQARNNYLLNEMGVAIVYPNVRGSSGYGKTYLTLDNGFKREDTVRDIGTIIDWIKRDPDFDSERIAVIGGSYGGYMSLACMTHYSDQLRAGIDVVGISNFITFLENTQDYRRDLRRVEYGDERDAAMRQFLEKISPVTNVKKIKKPLFVVQGKNDPRVPVTESEQMVKAIRDNGGLVWYLMAKDEGHGFAKKKNADFQFLATILFLREQLMK